MIGQMQQGSLGGVFEEKFGPTVKLFDRRTPPGPSLRQPSYQISPTGQCPAGWTWENGRCVSYQRRNGYQGAVGDLQADEAKLTPAQTTAMLDVVAALTKVGGIVHVGDSSIVPGNPPLLVTVFTTITASAGTTDAQAVAALDATAVAKGFGVVQAAVFTEPGSATPDATYGQATAIYSFPKALGASKSAPAAAPKDNMLLWALGGVAAIAVGVLAAKAGKTRSNPAGDDDSELELYAWNTGELYDSRKAVIAYMKREMARNAYDHGLGIERWRQWFLRAARMYKREIEDRTFSDAEVRRAAESVEHRVFGEIKRGEHD